MRKLALTLPEHEVAATTWQSIYPHRERWDQVPGPERQDFLNRIADLANRLRKK
jgi:hypothetical protein